MKIAYISQYFYPEQYFNNAVARALVERGHEVHVICSVPNYGQEHFFTGYSNSRKRYENWEGVRINRAWTVARGKSRVRLLLNYLTYPITASWTAWRHLKWRPDISFVSMPSPVFQGLVAIFLKKFRGVPSVFWVQDIWPESATLTLGLSNPLLVKPLHWISGWIYRQADCVLVQSEGFIPMIERFGVPRDLIQVLPNTARSLYEPVSPESAPEQASLVPQSGFRLMFAGNIGESQDFDNLMEAAHLLKAETDIHWVIIGSGRGMERAKNQVKINGLESQVHFLGRFEEEKMPQFFAHADALLVSLKDTPLFALTIPSKIQSYLACGKPIISALSGEGARVIELSGAGITVKPGDAGALAKAIVEMKMSSLRQKRNFGENGLNYFMAHFAPKKVYDSLEEALKDCCLK